MPALPVGMADFRAPTRGAATLWHGRPARDRHGQDGRGTIWLRLRRAALPGSAAMYTEGTASRPPTFRRTWPQRPPGQRAKSEGGSATAKPQRDTSPHRISALSGEKVNQSADFENRKSREQ